MSYKKVIWPIIIVVIGAGIYYYLISHNIIKDFITRHIATPKELLCIIIIGSMILLWRFFHNKAILKNKIDWAQYPDLEKIRNVIKILGIICLILSPINFLNTGVIEGYTGTLIEDIEEPVRIPSIMRLSLIIFPYIVYCDYIFLSGNPNALFHVRNLLMLLLLPFIIGGGFLCFLLYQDRLFVDFSNKYILCSFIVLPLLLAYIVKLVLITYDTNVNEVFPSKERKINILDLFLCFFLYYVGICLYSGNISSVENFIFKQAKIEDSNKLSSDNVIEQKTPIMRKSDKPIVIFYPQNATIIDAEGSHNFEDFDCPNMNIADRGNTIKVSWGGDNIVLNKTTNNEDTYNATGNTSRGKMTIKAYRSSTSGEIYLVTVIASNPRPNVSLIIINFKQ